MPFPYPAVSLGYEAEAPDTVSSAAYFFRFLSWRRLIPAPPFIHESDSSPPDPWALTIPSLCGKSNSRPWLLEDLWFQLLTTFCFCYRGDYFEPSCFTLVSYLSLLCLYSKGMWDTVGTQCTGLTTVLAYPWKSPLPSSSSDYAPLRSCSSGCRLHAGPGWK